MLCHISNTKTHFWVLDWNYSPRIITPKKTQVNLIVIPPQISVQSIKYIVTGPLSCIERYYTLGFKFELNMTIAWIIKRKTKGWLYMKWSSELFTSFTTDYLLFFACGLTFHKFTRDKPGEIKPERVTTPVQPKSPTIQKRQQPRHGQNRLRQTRPLSFVRQGPLNWHKFELRKAALNGFVIDLRYLWKVIKLVALLTRKRNDFLTERVIMNSKTTHVSPAQVYLYEWGLSHMVFAWESQNSTKAQWSRLLHMEPSP